MSKLAFIILAALFLSGCDAVQDLKDMAEKQGLIQERIREKYGWESQIGWNIHNGILTQVTVVLKAKDVRNERVSVLEAAAIEAVAHSFKSKPRAIYIQIASNVEN